MFGVFFHIIDVCGSGINQMHQHRSQKTDQMTKQVHTHY